MARLSSTFVREKTRIFNVPSTRQHACSNATWQMRACGGTDSLAIADRRLFSLAQLEDEPFEAARTLKHTHNQREVLKCIVADVGIFASNIMELKTRILHAKAEISSTPRSRDVLANSSQVRLPSQLRMDTQAILAPSTRPLGPGKIILESFMMAARRIDRKYAFLVRLAEARCKGGTCVFQEATASSR